MTYASKPKPIEDQTAKAADPASWYAGGIVTLEIHTEFGIAQVCYPERWRVKANSIKDAVIKLTQCAYLADRKMTDVWVMPVVGNADPSIAGCSSIAPNAADQGIAVKSQTNPEGQKA